MKGSNGLEAALNVFKCIKPLTLCLSKTHFVDQLDPTFFWIHYATCLFFSPTFSFPVHHLEFEKGIEQPLIFWQRFSGICDSFWTFRPHWHIAS